MIIATTPTPPMRVQIRNSFTSAKSLARLVAQRFVDDRCVQVAGDLTFTTLLALVPLFTIALTLISAFPVFEDWSNAFKVFLLTTLVPEVGGKVITVYMQQFADNAARLTAVGLLFLGVTALMLIVSIERVFNRIWRAHRNRTLMQRLVVYWTTITIGPLLIGASISLTSWLVAESIGVVGDGERLHQILLRIVPVILNGAAFGLVYLTLPNRRVRPKDALFGGMVAAVAFEAMKRGFAFYVQFVPTYSLIYGTFATIPVFLLWIYISWLVVLLGAVTAAVRPQWRLGVARAQSANDTRFFRALQVLDVLNSARPRSETLSVATLSTLSSVPEEEIEIILEVMDRLRWVRRVDLSGWALVSDLSAMTLLDVLRAFAIDVQPGGASDSDLVQGAGAALRQVLGKLDVPLDTLIESSTVEPPSAAQLAPGPRRV